jgi:hypothetical protein
MLCLVFHTIFRQKTKKSSLFLRQKRFFYGEIFFMRRGAVPPYARASPCGLALPPMRGLNIFSRLQIFPMAAAVLPRNAPHFAKNFPQSFRVSKLWKKRGTHIPREPLINLDTNHRFPSPSLATL